MDTAMTTNRLIVALDGDAADMGAVFLRLHRETPVRFFKVGPQMLLQYSGMTLVTNMLRERGVDLFYDGKTYDTRDTVANTVRRAFDLGARFVTVHATPSVMEAAMRAKPDDPRCKVLAVGPTSDRPISDFATFWDREFPITAITDGIIAPARALEMYPVLTRRLKDASKLLVCPGVRPDPEIVGMGWMEDWEYIGSHASCEMLAMALRAGADYLVVGRPITAAPDPVTAARAILQEMEEVLVT